MLSDPRARALWKRYYQRATYALGAVAATARREMLDHLREHVEEALRASDGKGSEYDRLGCILDRLGEPQDFLAPLVSGAVLSRPSPPNPLTAVLDSINVAWRLGSTVLAAAVAYPMLAIAGAALATLAFMRMLAPNMAGVFALAPDEYQVRILGNHAGGQQVMPLWAALLLLPLGAAIVAWAIARVRALALKLVLGDRARNTAHPIVSLGAE